MMLRRCFCFVATAVLCSAPACQAQVIIGDFETDLDGWTVNGAEEIAPSTIGATSGSQSLRVQGKLPGTFQWAIQLNDTSLASVIEANPILQYDVTWVTSDWLPDDGGWARVDAAAINSDVTNWKQTNDSLMTDLDNPSFPGSWDPVNWGDQHTRTVAYDLSSLAGGASAAAWFQVNLAINYDAAFDTAGGTFYIDNIRLSPVPEPGSFLILILGSLAIAFRRRTVTAVPRA